MNHRERVLTALSQREADRVPRTLHLMGEAFERFKRMTGSDNPTVYWDLDLSGWIGFQPPPVDWAERFGRYFDPAEGPLHFEFGDYPPEWGVACKPAGFYHFAAPRFPLARAASVRELERFPFPDYLKEWRHDHFESEVARQKAEGHPVVSWGQRLFQTAWYLRSREQLFVDAVENPAFVECLFERIADAVEPMAVRYAEAGADILCVADDIGMKDRMMIGPDWWRRWVKPRWARIFEAVRRVKPDMAIFYHSDGVIDPVIADLAEIGVTTLNTVQPECMDVSRIKKAWGRRLTLAGTVGVQSTLRWGTPGQVRETVRRQMAELGEGGGFILSPANVLEPDIPWENILAFMEAANGG